MEIATELNSKKIEDISKAKVTMNDGPVKLKRPSEKLDEIYESKKEEVKKTKWESLKERVFGTIIEYKVFIISMMVVISFLGLFPEVVPLLPLIVYAGYKLNKINVYGHGFVFLFDLLASLFIAATILYFGFDFKIEDTYDMLPVSLVAIMIPVVLNSYAYKHIKDLLVLIMLAGVIYAINPEFGNEVISFISKEVGSLPQ